MAAAWMMQDLWIEPQATILPQPAQLAALGAVLCLYRPQPGGALAGWRQATYAEAQVGVESDGLRESLCFFDREGRACWRLCLLPDSDFLAWDRLAACLPSRVAEKCETGVGQRLWQRLARRLTGESWCACILQLHVLPQPFATPSLAASLAAPSPLGEAMAHDIAHAEMAEPDWRNEGIGDASSGGSVQNGATAAADAAAFPLCPNEERHA